MDSFQEKEMYVYNNLTAQESFGDMLSQIPHDFDGFVFYTLKRDSIGLSAANPTWGDFYQYKDHEVYYKGVCVYKEMDYDFPYAPYCEKIWSLLGKRILKNCRVPHIDIVKDKKHKETGTISHIVLDNDFEDMLDMKTILFFKFERFDLNNNKTIVNLKDMLECVKIQIDNDENYLEVESSIVQTLLLDAISNNADRHANNWALIRNKQTNHYCLGLFDHSISFIDMIKQKSGVTKDGWTSTYTQVKDSHVENGIGDLGNTVVSYLFEHYPHYCAEFVKNFDNEIEGFYEDISSLPSSIDQNRLKKCLSSKRKYLEKLLQRDEFER